MEPTGGGAGPPSEDHPPIAREELLALALAGFCEEAIELLKGFVAPEDGSGGSDSDHDVLLQARLLLAASAAAGLNHARGIELLETLARRDGPGRWRALMEQARRHRREGRPKDAAGALKRALSEFRRAAVSSGREGEALARILSAEAGGIARIPHGDGFEGPPHGGTDHPGQQAAVGRTPVSLVQLVELGKRLAIETDPDQVLRIVLHAAIDLGGAERGFVVLAKGEQIDFALAEKMDWSEVERPAFEVSRTLIREVSRSGRSAFLCLADLPDDHPASHSLLDRGVCAVACVPMVGTGGTMGVLYLDRRSPPGSFGEDTRWLLDLFAGQAAAALENARAHREKARALEAAEELNRRQRAESERRVRYGTLVGASDGMAEIYRRLDLITPTEMPVLILGETGTGKELVARLIHDRSPRKQGGFVAINCAGLADSLLESELFGHERGAFTGADRARPGLFEAAHNGTLFLDEVGDMSPRMQGELLRALESGEVRRVGGRETIHVDARVIAATHRDLEERMRRNEFRQDLFFRLNVLGLRLPPLREHVEDIPLLAAEILEAAAKGTAVPRITEAAMRRLMACSWPGNVRELGNVLRRLLVLGLPEIEEEHLPDEILRPPAATARDGTLRQVEADAIRRALEAAGGNKTEAARILGMHRKTLHLKLKQMGAG